MKGIDATRVAQLSSLSIFRSRRFLAREAQRVQEVQSTLIDTIWQFLSCNPLCDTTNNNKEYNFSITGDLEANGEPSRKWYRIITGNSCMDVNAMTERNGVKMVLLTERLK